ncbi:START domain-containing protein [Spirosoma daeguense]
MRWMVLLVIALLGMSRIGFSQVSDDWNLEKEKDGIRVYSRNLTGNRLKELRVQCTFQGTLSALVAMLSDVENYPKLMYKTKTSRLLRRISETEMYYYIETELPWPVENRDMNVHLLFTQDPDTRALRVQINKTADEVPPQPHIVRVADWLAVWEVQPQPNQQLQIDYHCRVNPGGSLPVWLVNLTATTGPYESFKLLRKTIRNSQYQGRKFKFLME